MERPELDNYKQEIHHPNGTIEDVWDGTKYVDDLNKYLDFLEGKTKDDSEISKVKWVTVESINGSGVMKQHAYAHAERGQPWEDKYDGNKSLCGHIGVHDGEKFVEMSELESESINEKCCQKCLKKYNSMREVGYYWVYGNKCFDNDLWVVLYWDGDYFWAGNEDFSADVFKEIDERRIVRA